MRKDIVCIICPDVHGRDFWEFIIDVYDGSVPLIFLGDYLDPYQNEGITPEDAHKVFEKIWELKQKWGDKVILLIGNHDASYMSNYNFECCRYSKYTDSWYPQFLSEHEKDFKICHIIKNNNINYLLSHAGVNPKWMAQHGLTEEDINEEFIGKLFKEKPEYFNEYSYYRGGYHRSGSPIWSDIREYKNITPISMIQIVGHTMLLNDFIQLNNVYCIDSQRLFVITKDDKIEPYIKKEKEE